MSGVRISGWMGAVVLSLAVFCVSAESVSLQDRMQLADGLFRRGFFDLAEKEYGALSNEKQVKQGMDDILFRLAECRRRLKQTKGAETTYLQLIQRFPHSPHNARARLQCALLQLDAEDADAARTVELLEPLTLEGQPEDVRSAALYHYAQALEKMKQVHGAIAYYGQIRKFFPVSEYAMYANLNIARLLAQTGKPEALKKAMEIYLDLSKTAKDPRVAEEALYFAANLALDEKDYPQSAKLFLSLQMKYPQSPRFVASLLSSAVANYYAGNYKEAVLLLDKTLANRANPNREQALYLKANCLRQLAQNDEALTVYHQLMDEFPKAKILPEAWYEALTVVYAAGKYDEALKLIAKEVEPVPAYEDQIYWIAAESAMAVSNRSDLVVQNCKRLVERCPKSPFVKDALYRLGWLENKREAWEAAAGWFVKVAEQFPQDPLAPKALYSAGICHARMGLREVALRDWTALLTRYPTSPEAPETLYQKAMEEIRGKDYRAARATLDERERRFPKSPRAADSFYWRGSISRQLKDFGDAESCYRACLALHPPKEIEREAMLELGSILLEQKKDGEAAMLFQQLLDSPVAGKIGPDRLAWLSSFQLKQGKLDSAAHAAKILVEGKPDKGWLQTGWTLLGRVHRKKGERDPAIHAFREAMKSGASTEYAAEAALRLGELLSDAGQFDEATTWLDDAAKRASTPEQVALRANAYLGLARNAERRGTQEEALRYYISVGILFEDSVIVPEALSKSVALLQKLGRPVEAESLREELKNRYPDSPQAKEKK